MIVLATAATVTITITSSLFLVYSTLKRDFGWRFWVALAVWLVILVFLTANLPKIASGGWLPILIGTVMCALMFCWRSGRRQLQRWRQREEMSPAQFLDIVDAGEVTRVAGTGVFVTPSAERIPVALGVMMNQQHALPQQVILFTWETAHAPVVADHERLTIRDIHSPEPGIVLLTARYGYRERIHPVRALEEAAALEPGILRGLDLSKAVFYLQLPVVEVVTRSPARFAREVFALLTRMRTDPVKQLSLPRERTVIIGREAQL
nr:KUP/HAK/KT family potassium transporter [Gulosibacter chungangensis]